MSVTITVQDPLAAQLRLRAEVEQISIEKLAAELLSQGLNGGSHRAWDEVIARRTVLLRKSTSQALSAAEIKELQKLQSLIDQRVEVLDVQRMAEVERMEEEVRRALQQTDSGAANGL